MKKKDVQKLIIFNSFIFCIITALSIIMLFRPSKSVSNVWDGTTATSFAGGSGTSSSPYQISNGAELDYFFKMCNENSSYRSKRYIITRDIYLNDGTFELPYSTDDSLIYYYKDYIRYNVSGDSYSANFYSNYNVSYNFNQLRKPSFGFSGVFDGGGHTIYGLYIYGDNDTTKSDTFMSTILTGGKFCNIKFSNSAIIGKLEVGLLGQVKGTVSNMVYNGIIIDNYFNEDDVVQGGVSASSSSEGKILNLTRPSSTYEAYDHHYHGFEIRGRSSGPFRYNGRIYEAGDFKILLGSHTSSVNFKNIGENFQLSNLGYYGRLYYGVTGVIVFAESTAKIANVASHGYIYGTSSVGGIVGRTLNSSYNTNVTKISYSYSSSIVRGYDNIGGIIGNCDSYSRVNLKTVFNTGSVRKEYWYLNGNNLGGLVGSLSGVSLNFTNCINNDVDVDGQFIGCVADGSNYSFTRSYYTKSGDNVILIRRTSSNVNGSISVISGTDYREPNTFKSTSLSSYRYYSYSESITSEESVWLLSTRRYPRLYFEDDDIFYGKYNTFITEGIDEKTIVYDDFEQYRNNSIINIHCRHHYYLFGSNPFDDDNVYEYIYFRNILPVGTKITLYDEFFHTTYTYTTTSVTSYEAIEHGQYYKFDLSELKSIYDQTYYNNNIVDHINSDGDYLKEDIIISFEFPSTTNNYSFNAMFASSPSDRHNPIYVSDAIDFDVGGSAATYSMSSNKNFNFNTNGSSNYVLRLGSQLDCDSYGCTYDPSFFEERFLIETTLKNSSGTKLSPFIGYNFHYIANSNYLENNSNYGSLHSGGVYNNNSNSVATQRIKGVRNSLGSLYHLDIGSIVFDIETLDTRYLNILNSSYYMYFDWKMLDGTSYGSRNDNFSLNTASPRDGVSFEAKVDDNAHFISSSSGGTFKIKYKYSGYFTNKKLVFRIKKHLSTNGSATDSVVLPSGFFNISDTEYINDGNGIYYNLCNVSGSPNNQLEENLTLKTGLSAGSYSMEVALAANGKIISSDIINFVVK